MGLIRRGIVAGVIGLHMVMKQPVWFIFDRVSGFIGGDGWHRSNLIDKFVKHFGEWWVAGMPIENTGDWAATKMPWGGVDVTDYYVSIGLNGGLVSLVVFIALLTACFKLLGKALQTIREQNPELNPSSLETMVWGAGCAVLGHVVNVSAVMYWDQSYVIWYLHLAVATSLASYCLKNQPVGKASSLPQEEGAPAALALVS
jgi:hypothetical protein